MEGRIISVDTDRGFGFINADGSPDLFFHATDLIDRPPFDERLRWQRVVFDADTTDKGPRARNVRTAD